MGKFKINQWVRMARDFERTNHFRGELQSFAPTALRTLGRASLLGTIAVLAVACGGQGADNAEANGDAAPEAGGSNTIERDIDQGSAPVVDDQSSLAMESPDDPRPVALADDAVPPFVHSAPLPESSHEAGDETLGTIQQSLVAPGFLAVWQPGSGGQFWRSGMADGDLKLADKRFFNKGYRIKSIDVYTYKSCDPFGCVTNHQYAAVWEPGSGAQAWHSGMASASFVAKANSYGAQGLRIAALAVNTNGNFTAVWRPGNMAERLYTNMSSATLKARDMELWNAGYNLVHLVQYDGKYTAVWQALGKSGVRGAWGQSLASMVSLDATYYKQGLRLQTIDVRSDKFLGVWHTVSNPGAQLWQSGLTASDMEAKDLAYFKSGLRLKALRVRKYEWPDAPTTRQRSDGGGMTPAPSNCNGTMYGAVARVDACYNVDGSISTVVDSGTITGAGWGCTLAAAQSNARASLSAAVGCVSSSAAAGCCTFSYD